VPAATNLNLWKRNSAGMVTSYLAGSDGTTARSFSFVQGVAYVLILNSGSYSLSTGSTTTTVNSPTTVRVFPAVIQAAVDPTIVVSSASTMTKAQHLVPVQATVLATHSYGTTTYSILAELQYNRDPATADPVVLAFPQSMIELLDASGQVLYSTQTATDPGYKYFYAPNPSRYSTSSGWNYDVYEVFSGDRAYATVSLSVADTDTANPLFGFDVSRVAKVRFTTVATSYQYLAFEPVPTTIAPASAAGPVLTGSQFQALYTSPGAAPWWQMHPADAYLVDSQGRLLSHDYESAVGSHWILVPGGSTTLTVPVPSDLVSATSAATFLLDYSETTAPAASYAPRAGLFSPTPDRVASDVRSDTRAKEAQSLLESLDQGLGQ
jgi:hypothetical protein